MVCKNCQKEMPEIGDFCPFCGAAKEPEEVILPEAEETLEIPAEEVPAEGEVTETELVEGELTEEELFAEEETPAEEAPAKKKISPRHLAMVIAGGVVLLAVLVFAILFGMGVDLKPRSNDLYYRNSYTVDAEKLEKSADTVVATMGDKKLTLAELQLHYMNSIYSFYSQNYYYMAYMGLDMTQPLDSQPCMMDESMTWEQYFLDAALKSWESYTLVELMAEDAGYQVNEVIQAQIDAIPQQVESVALNNGYATAEEYLHDQMGAGVDMETYLRFNNSYFVCNEYINSLYAACIPTQEEIDAYYASNEATFTANGVTPDIGLISDVRHILIQPEGGTTDETGVTTYSEEEWALALEEAEKILEEWKSGAATEESFAELANTHSADGGSNTTGGLYQDIHADSSYVPEFRSWAVDANRKTGDTEIVKTDYGYHIMYFVQGEDYFNYMVEEQLIADYVQQQIKAAQEIYTVDINYKKIKLCPVNFG